MDSGRPFTIGELATLIKGTPNFIEFLKTTLEEAVTEFYDLALMPSSDDETLKKNRLYISKNEENGLLHYSVINPKGTPIINQVIQFNELKTYRRSEFKISLESDDICEALKPFLSDILEITLKKGHTVTEDKKINIHPVAYRNINNYIQKATKEQSGIKSTITSRLNLWDDPFINAATSRSDFDLKKMRQEKMTVYLGIPPNQLNRLAPLMNLFIQLFLTVMTESLPKLDEPHKVLVILDEFCALGRMETVKTGFGYLAGYNLHLIAAIQNIGQFYALYGRDDSEVFFQNTDYKIAYRQNA